MLNPIQKLRSELIRRFPNYTTELDDCEGGRWFLDIFHTDDSPYIVVEWRPGYGFGVSTLEEGDYGVGPDEIYSDVQSVFDRVVQLILSGGSTIPCKQP